MDDQRTRDTLDALADLFLTEADQQRDAVDSTRPTDPDTDATGDDPADAPAGQRITTQASDLDGPQPIRMRPAPAAAPARLNLEPRLTPGAKPPAQSQSESSDADASGDDVDEAAEHAADDDTAPYPFMPGMPRSVEQAQRATPQQQSAEPTAASRHQTDAPAPEPRAASTPERQRDAPPDSAAETVPPSSARQEDREQTGAVHRDAPLYVEAVLLGNLPGFGGPWLTQYAQLLAQESGPVAVVHVDPGQMDLELVEPRDGTPSASVLEGLDTHQPDASLMSLLQSLLDRAVTDDKAARAVGTVLFHVSDMADARQLFASGSVSDWTLITGSDEAAVVAGSTTIQQLAEPGTPARSGASSSQDAGDIASPRVGLMIMGSEQAQAQAANDRIQAALQDHVPTPIQLVGFQKRMEPVNLSFLGSFQREMPDFGRLQQLIDRYPRAVAEVIDTAEALPTEPAQPPHESIDPQQDPPATASFDSIETKPDPEPTHERGSFGFSTQNPAAAADQQTAQSITGQAPQPAPATPQRESPAQTQTQAQAPRQPDKPAAPATPAPAAPAASADEVDLTDFVTMGNPDATLDGAIALEARCPDYPRVQFLLAQDGRLHLLARHQSGQGAAADHQDLRDAVIDLLDAQRWTDRHLELIQLTQRQLRMDAARPPELHLFVDDARLAHQLNQKLGQTLTLHLLEQITVGSQQAWYSTRLS